jgi:hypothetical protein
MRRVYQPFATAASAATAATSLVQLRAADALKWREDLQPKGDCQNSKKRGSDDVYIEALLIRIDMLHSHCIVTYNEVQCCDKDTCCVAQFLILLTGFMIFQFVYR